MTAKEKLEQLGVLDMEINRKIERLRDLYADLFRGSSVLDGIPANGQKSRSFENRMERYVLLRDEINRDIDSLVDRKEEIRKAIDALPDERHRSALEMYYLRGMTSEQIGRRLGYDTRHIRRFLKTALELIKL